MTTRPARPAQTTTEVRKAFKKNGPRLQDAELRKLQRGHELDQRAARIREQEERRRAAKRKREENERKQCEARRQLGVGLATQMIGYSRTQAQLKKGMEAFVGLKKSRPEQDIRQLEVNKKLAAIAETVEKEPWDYEDDGEFDLGDISTDNVPVLAGADVESFTDDDLDDETLLEAHDKIVQEHRLPPPEPSFKSHPIPALPPAVNFALRVPDKPLPPKTTLQKPNTPFRIPKLPASKTAQGATPMPPPVPLILDDWEDLLASSTQIARELSSDSHDTALLECNHANAQRHKSTSKPLLAPVSKSSTPVGNRQSLHEPAAPPPAKRSDPITRTNPPTTAAAPPKNTSNIRSELGISSQELALFLDDDEF